MLNEPWKLSNFIIQRHFKSRYEIFLFTWVIIQDYTKVGKFLFHFIPGSAFVNLLLKKGNGSKHSARKSKLAITLSMNHSITLQLIKRPVLSVLIINCRTGCKNIHSLCWSLLKLKIRHLEIKASLIHCHINLSI